MSSFSVKLPPSVVDRLGAYLASEFYRSLPAMSEHWTYHATQNQATFKIKKPDLVEITQRKSGLDTDFKNTLARTKTRANESIILQIKRLFLNHVMGIYIGIGFNAVHHFNVTWPNGKGKLNSQNLKVDLALPLANPSAMKAAHIFNEFWPFIEPRETKRGAILEIGPGSGHFQYIFRTYFPTYTSILVDLPTSIPFSFINLMRRFPEQSFLLPNELPEAMHSDAADCIWITPTQTDQIPHHSIDIVIQTMGFQEMCRSDIETYFELVRSKVTLDNIFYCLNAVEKPMWCGGELELIRFHEYPWRSSDCHLLFGLSNVEEGRTYRPFFRSITKLDIVS